MVETTDGLRLTPGTKIKVWWEDSPDQVVLLTSKPDTKYGLTVFDGETTTGRVDFYQVVSVEGRLEL